MLIFVPDERRGDFFNKIDPLRTFGTSAWGHLSAGAEPSVGLHRGLPLQIQELTKRSTYHFRGPGYSLLSNVQVVTLTAVTVTCSIGQGGVGSIL